MVEDDLHLAVHPLTLRLVQPVLGREPEVLRTVEREARHEQGGAPGVEDGVRARNLGAEDVPGLVCRHRRIGDVDDALQVLRQRNGRGVDGFAVRNDDAHAAHERGGDVVRVSLDLRGQLQQPVRRERIAEQRVRGVDAAHDGRRTAAESPAERYLLPRLYREAAPGVAGLYQHALRGAVHEVAGVAPQVLRAQPVQAERRLVGPAHAHRVPERQRHAEAVEAWPEVRCGRGNADGEYV